MSTKVTKDLSKAFARSLRALTDKQVLVGIPSKTAGRRPEPGEPSDINNAAIGYLMETGSPAANLPERPHLKVGVASVKDPIIERYKAGGKAVLDRAAPNLDATHTAVGLIAQAGVRAKITAGPFAPLADTTLAARRRKGRTGTKPLIDTGQYRQAINFVVRPKG